MICRTCPREFRRSHANQTQCRWCRPSITAYINELCPQPDGQTIGALERIWNLNVEDPRDEPSPEDVAIFEAYKREMDAYRLEHPRNNEAPAECGPRHQEITHHFRGGERVRA